MPNKPTHPTPRGWSLPVFTNPQPAPVPHKGKAAFDAAARKGPKPRAMALRGPGKRLQVPGKGGSR